MLTWPVKDPNEVLDYEIDWATNRLQTGETISTSTFTVVEGTVVIDSDSDLDGVTKVWLSGGTEGEACVILNRIVTSAGRTYDQSAKLRIRSK
jgi:hypothetical protein